MLVEEFGTWLKGFFSWTVPAFIPTSGVAGHLEHRAIRGLHGHEQLFGKDLKSHYRLIYNQRCELPICQPFPINNHSLALVLPGYYHILGWPFKARLMGGVSALWLCPCTCLSFTPQFTPGGIHPQPATETALRRPLTIP